MWIMGWADLFFCDFLITGSSDIFISIIFYYLQNVTEVYPFHSQVPECFEGVVDGNNIQRYLHLQGSSSLSSQPSLSGVSCDSFDVDRSASNEGMIPNPVCSFLPLTWTS